VEGHERRENSRVRDGAPAYLKWFALAAAAAVLFASWFFLPVKDWLQAWSGWIRDAGLLGYLVFAIGYAAAAVLLAPGPLLTIAAGFAFGMGGGLPVVMAGAVLSSALAYLLARSVLRQSVERMARERPRWAALDAALAHDGWKTVLLFRISPLIPFNVQSYLLGVTRIGFWPYMTATIPAILPGTILYLYVGTLSRSLLRTTQHGFLHWLLLFAGLVATMAVSLLVVRRARLSLAAASGTDDMAIRQATEAGDSEASCADVPVPK
jgi:uncharacterized membrane protein YdjX (TVP38/TMEM64 family)